MSINFKVNHYDLLSRDESVVNMIEESLTNAKVVSLDVRNKTVTLSSSQVDDAVASIVRVLLGKAWEVKYSK